MSKESCPFCGDNWRGYCDCKGQAVAQLTNQVDLLKEDLECVHLFLDHLGTPFEDEEGRRYSIVGRLKAAGIEEADLITMPKGVSHRSSNE